MYKLLFLLFLTGCTAVAVKQFDAEYGLAQTQNRIVDASTVDGEFYYHQIKPILENRCVVCHGCYYSPCQLKLSSPEGIDRGLTKQRIFDSRLSAINPTRLFEDAQSTNEWRLKGFNPVLNERLQTPEANLQASLLYKMLELKKNNPLPETDILAGDYDFSIDRAESCPTIETYNNFAENHPTWGMPFGLPGLSDDEFSKMEQWLANGASMTGLPPLDPSLQQQIEQWEQFLNQNSNKHRLMSRYLYEHLFLTHLYFEKQPKDNFFTLIRSKTPPGQAIERIATRHPYDEPNVERVYYRLVREQATILEKTHIPYRMDKARMQRWQLLFIDENYEVTLLPGYQAEITANPFITFQDMPVHSKYQFLLDDSQTFIMGFIKGPVCRGELALDVIEDRFWVFFENPETTREQLSDAFLAQQSDHLRLPTESQNLSSIVSWHKYAELQQTYFQAKERVLKQKIIPLNIAAIWDGDGHNTNAALTVFRHFNNASVVQGTVGEQPKSAWIIDYALFERIHYLLVAGFDPFGNIAHQLTTRLYMDFLRIEAEFNFAAFLPPENRKSELNYWYRGANDVISSYLDKKHEYADIPTDIQYTSSNYKQELFQKIQQHLGNSLSHKYTFQTEDINKKEQIILHQLSSISDKATSILPEVIFIRVIALDGKEHFYTLLHNRGYANVTSLVAEDKNRLPNEDDLTLVPGFVGSYPNVFWDVKSTEMNDLISRIETLSSEADYQKLLDHYGVRRTSREFWALSDRAHAIFKQKDPIKSGLFDYNHLENR